MSPALFLSLMTLAAIDPIANETKAPPRTQPVDVEAHAFDVAPLPPAPRDTTRAATATSSRALRPDHERLYYDTAADGTVWVRGKTFKASFGPDGATYVPFLGSQAPRNFPVSLRVNSVTIGSE